MENKETINKKYFWASLKRPFFVLAPMANVTDSVFRKLFSKYGKPDVTWTEFVSADGLISPGRDKLLVDLEYSKDERPIVAQLFTGHPEAMEGAAKLVAKLGFDGLDINMGCPDRAVEKQGGGAANIKDPKNAIKVIEAARKGAPNLPITVKTRLGYNQVDLNWLRTLLEQKLPVLTVHLRTRKEMSDVPAHWELMPDIIKLRNEISPETMIIGNGDVDSMAMAYEYVNKYGCDGIMIGRGIFGKPWFFTGKEKTPEERLKILLEHSKLFEKTFRSPGKEVKAFDTMKKHFKAYVSGWDGAKELRVDLMGTHTYREVKTVVDNYLSKEIPRDRDLVVN
jgi:nifR3 family TIM-barrel protein